MQMNSSSTSSNSRKFVGSVWQTERRVKWGGNRGGMEEEERGGGEDGLQE